MELETIRTDRLVGEKLRLDHFGALLDMHSNPKLMATLGSTRDGEPTRKYLEDNLLHWQCHGYGIWILSEAENERICGRAGLRRLEVEGVQEIELAYALFPEVWGRGFATEVGRYLTQLGLFQFNFPSIVSFTITTNENSQRVVRKIGFRFEKGIHRGKQPHVLYRINREMFLETRK